MSTATAPAPRHAAGIAYMLAGAFSLACSDALAKWLGTHYPPMQLLLLRAALATPALLALVALTLGPAALRTANLGIHTLRGLINVVCAICFYWSMTLLPLAHTTALTFCAPLFIALISALVLKERLGLGAWLAIGAGFFGVVLIAASHGGGAQATHQPLWAMALPVITALGYAIMMLSARRIRPGEHMLTTMTYIVLGQLVFAAPIALLGGFWVPLSPAHAPQLAALALCATLGLGFITQAFRLAPAAVVVPFDYSLLLWSTLLGWLIWREQPAWGFYLGAALIVAAGLYTALRHARR